MPYFEHYLFGIHTATKNPGQSEEGWLRTMVGDPVTGEAGRIICALQMAQRIHPLCQPRLYLFVSPDQLGGKTWDDEIPRDLLAAINMVHKHADAFKLDRDMALRFLADIHVDWWDGVPANQINTNGEAVRLVAYAKANGYEVLCPVSTGYGHTPRVVQVDYVEARKHGLRVWGCAETPFEGLPGATATIVDPEHLAGAPFIRPGKASMASVIGDIFRTCKADPALYAEVLGWLEDKLAAIKARSSAP